MSIKSLDFCRPWKAKFIKIDKKPEKVYRPKLLVRVCVGSGDSFSIKIFTAAPPLPELLFEPVFTLLLEASVVLLKAKTEIEKINHL